MMMQMHSECSQHVRWCISQIQTRSAKVQNTNEQMWRTWNSSLWRWIMLSDRVTPISLQKLLMACGAHEHVR
jgi:hypothetical protein